MDGYLQERRLLQLDTVLDKDQMILVSVAGVDRISALFAYDLDLVSTEPDLKPDDLLGSSMTVYLHPYHDQNPVSIDGIVSVFAADGTNNHGLHHYRARLVPALWLLTRTSDCRIFQDLSVRDIVDKVLTDYGITRREWKLAGDHIARDYCVQYRETAFNFICRLLEEEGISFYFRQDKDGHTLVLCDYNHGFAPCASASVPIEPDDRLRYGIWDWKRTYHLRSAKWALEDYNFETPSSDLLSRQNTVNSVLKKRPLEMYDYPGRFQKSDSGDALTKLRIEYEEAAYQEISGESGCTGFAAGGCFKLANPLPGDADQEFLITEVHHTAEDLALMVTDRKPSYSNSFRCVPRATPYRPPMQTRRPHIRGTQTAVVTGPAGSEIFTDKYGRIKVQFHWDRYGKKDEHSSCFIRVAQVWAGKGFGGIFLPRIGQEVVVSFQEGDPDQPLVVGSVYNAEQTVPYGLPGNQTQSGMKTHSSMGGSTANFNELRFEDKKGSELVTLHAEKDLETAVENDASHWVGHDETTAVDHDRTEHVKHDETITIDNNRTETVHANETITIDKNRTETVHAN